VMERQTQRKQEDGRRNDDCASKLNDCGIGRLAMTMYVCHFQKRNNMSTGVNARQTGDCRAGLALSLI